MRIAVTGAAGFVGLNIVRRCCEAGHEVLALDRNFGVGAAGILGESGAAHGQALDILDGAALGRALGQFKPEALFHGATLTANLDREKTAFSDIVQVNVVGTAKVLEAALAAGVGRIIVASSSAVYGDSVFSAPVREDGEMHPITLYGITKLAAEQAALRFAAIHGADIRIARIAAVFGAFEHRSGARDAMSPLFQIAARAHIDEEAILPAGGARDWIDAGRVADVIRAMIEAPDLAHRVYNVAAIATWEPAVFAESLSEVFGAWSWRVDDAHANIAHNDDLARRRFALDTSRIRSAFGDDILGTPQADAADYARWAQANPAWFNDTNKGKST